MKKKSKIVNLKKSKSNFLGFELKIVDTKRKHKERRTNVKNKSSKTKYILQVRVSKEKICEMSREFKESLKLLIKDANNSSKIIGRLNTKILGWQNYCKLSTYPSKDLNEVYMRNYTKMNVLKRYYGILKCVNMNEAKKVSKLINERYSEYNGFTFMSNFGGVIYPIWAIKQQKLSQRNPKRSPYVRDDLVKYWYKALKWNNSEGEQLIENYCNSKWVNKAYLNKLRKMLNLEPIMIMP